MNKVYILQVIDRDQVLWECNVGVVVVACSPDCARRIANENSAGEGKVWMNDSVTSCEEVDTNIERIILSDNTGA